MTAYLVTILTLVSISALVGLALNLQWGLCGMVNFGLAGFFAVGAYSYGLLGVAGVPPAPALLAAAAICAGLAALLALLAVRLSDDYLAIVTIGFAEVVKLVSLNESWLTRGALGLADVQQPLASLVPPSDYPLLFLGIVLAVLALVYLLLERLTRSPFGRLVRAVREDDVVASTLGKSVLSVRVRAFTLGGAILGIAGGLHAAYVTYIDPSQFTPIITAYAFMAVIAGGRGSNRGLLLGAGTIMLLIEGTRFLKDAIPLLDGTQLAALRLGLVGVGLIVLLIYRPQGFLAEPRQDSRKLFPNGNSGDR